MGRGCRARRPRLKSRRKRVDQPVHPRACQTRDSIPQIGVFISFALQNQILFPQGNGRHLIRLGLQEHAEIGRFGPGAGALDPDPFNHVARLAQSGGIQKRHGQAAQIHAHLDHIARGARDIRGNGRLTTC